MRVKPALGRSHMKVSFTAPQPKYWLRSAPRHNWPLKHLAAHSHATLFVPRSRFDAFRQAHWLANRASVSGRAQAGKPACAIVSMRRWRSASLQSGALTKPLDRQVEG